MLQEELAGIFEVHPKTVPNWELGNTEPQDPRLFTKIVT